MSEITSVHAREIIDCRGIPTLEVEVTVDGWAEGRFGVPSGLSRGSYEAFELRDGDSRFRGLGVRKAVENVNRVIAPAIMGMDALSQREIDMALIELDGTADKSKLGANAILGVSVAVAKAASSFLGVPFFKYMNQDAHILPVPQYNLINGGKHASNDLEFQEFIIMPEGAESFSESLRIASEVNFTLREILEERYGKVALNVGDEGGFAPPISDVREALDVLVEAVRKSGYEDEISYALDVASTHFYDREKGLYVFQGLKLEREEMIEFYELLTSDYQIVSIEDPLYEDDFEGYVELTKALDVQIVGDDLFVTNPKRLKKGIELGAANALLWKMNQIGTLTEAWDVAQMALRNRYNVVVSERSGETEDETIADLTVALNCGQIKTGAPVRGERTSKYNQLLRIEEFLGDKGVFAGRRWRKLY